MDLGLFYTLIFIYSALAASVLIELYSLLSTVYCYSRRFSVFRGAVSLLQTVMQYGRSRFDCCRVLMHAAWSATFEVATEQLQMNARIVLLATRQVCNDGRPWLSHLLSVASRRRPHTRQGRRRY